MRAAQNLPPEHGWQRQISAVGRAPGHLAFPVWPHSALADPLVFQVVVIHKLPVLYCFTEASEVFCRKIVIS